MTTFGVHSEVGHLRQVMVHRPELSLKRLTPSNHDDLLFDDVLWVERAQYEHDQFVEKMRSRGVEVFLLSDLLAALAPADLATHLIGGLTVAEAGLDPAKAAMVSLIGAALDDPGQFVLP